MTGRCVTDEWVAESVRRTRAAQGLSATVTDPVALDQVATLVGSWFEERAASAARPAKEPGTAA